MARDTLSPAQLTINTARLRWFDTSDRGGVCSHCGKELGDCRPVRLWTAVAPVREARLHPACFQEVASITIVQVNHE